MVSGLPHGLAAMLYAGLKTLHLIGVVLLLALGGYGAALVAGLDVLNVSGLVWGQGLPALSGALWAGLLIPVQIRQGRQARAFAESGEIRSKHRSQRSS
ncbi:MAG: hypothetical protein MZV65_50150 [Chromatiales bacterium]|nr:hypothetical protein [Chromatiales bacterium]